MEWEFLHSLAWLTSSLCFCCDHEARWLCAGDLTLAILPALRMDRMWVKHASRAGCWGKDGMHSGCGDRGLRDFQSPFRDDLTG